jgi:NTP pyrophosphatase (non-canonical NTP hydrolase)
VKIPVPMNDYQTFDKLLKAISQGLPEIQKCFDNYQEEFFLKRQPEFFCLELNGEAGELANAEKKIWKGLSIPQEKLEDEAADVFIALLNYVNSRKLNLTDALITKLNKIHNSRVNQLNNDNK